jgi:WD40 repeat protein
MARIWRHRAAIGAGLWLLLGLALAPARADDPSSKERTDLYDRPVLAIDPGMHTGVIWTQAVDGGGRFAVTGSDDRTVRIWSIADGKLLHTIWIPQGPESVGRIYAVAISPTDQRSRPAAILSGFTATAQSTYSTATPETSFGEFTATCLMSPTVSRSRQTAVT